MNKAIIDRQNDGTIKLTLTLPKAEIEKARQTALESFAKTAKIDGFREGKAPLKMVEERVDKDRLKEEILKKLLPEAYSKAVGDNNLKPIMSPKIHVDKLEDNSDWEVHAFTCESPEIDLGKYKDKVKTVTSKSKIIVPGKEEQKPSSQEVMNALASSVTAKIPAILVEQEADRLLSQLLGDIKKLGLTLDQYMASTNRTPEALREEYTKRAEEDLKLEFALQKISETENITVDPKEIDEAIAKAKSPEEKQSLEANRYMLAAILRQQKTLDFLLRL